MNQSNCMVAQSGGPTAAINASLAGVISGIKKSGKYDTCYAVAAVAEWDFLRICRSTEKHK